jgi:hypothetical protein
MEQPKLAAAAPKQREPRGTVRVPREATPRPADAQHGLRIVCVLPHQRFQLAPHHSPPLTDGAAARAIVIGAAAARGVRRRHSALPLAPRGFKDDSPVVVCVVEHVTQRSSSSGAAAALLCVLLRRTTLRRQQRPAWVHYDIAISSNKAVAIVPQTTSCSSRCGAALN